MHPICQQTLIANFNNSELQHHGMDVDGLLANPNVRKFIDWVANKISRRPWSRSSAEQRLSRIAALSSILQNEDGAAISALDRKLWGVIS